MKKKILSMMLVLALMLSLSPAAVPRAHAEGGNEASVTVDGVTTEYATLEDALTGVYSKTATIDLLTDVTVEASIDLFSKENLLLRGNGYSITGTGSARTISVQNAKLILDNVHICNSSGSSYEVVWITSSGTLTLQNNASVISDTSMAIVNLGTLIITDGTVATNSESDAIVSEDAVMELEAPAESEIHITSNDVNAVSAQSSSVTIAGNLYMGGIRAVKSYTGEQVATVKLSGALTGDPISVYYGRFSQLDTSDFAMIAPAEGYTITEDDAEMIKPQDIDFSACLGEDGWIWAKYAHVHRASDDQYQSLENGQHSFGCDCGETVEEDCVYEQQCDDRDHWLECIHCGYTEPDSVKEHVLQNCVCECGFLGHQVDQWIAAPDLLTHTGVCTACGEELSEEHAGIWGNDDDSHWWFCAKNCGYRGENEAHGWSPYIPRDGQNSHYRQCYCGTVMEEYHTDSDNDLICEKCGGELCYDTDDDHRCDDCDLFMEMLCVDDDNNHRCDAELCGERVAAWCVDANNDHCCDVAECGTYLWELCIDDDGDWFCDVCRIDLCDHWVEDIVPNEDNTHTGVCGNCNRDITEDCTFADGMEWNDSMHWDCCICGRRGNEASHVYSEVISKTPVGHEKMCEGCDSTHLEAHRFVDGVCADCGTEQTDCYDVYVGGIGLKSGDYVDQAGNKTTTMPEDGYAHYENGVLTLHNYFYDGDGILWKEEPDTGSDIRFTAAIYATTELILELSGDNSLSNTSGEEDVQRDGIASEQDLIIRGQGSLNVLADNDGIHLRGGDLTIEEGILSLGALYEDENGDWVNIEIGDDGIDLDYGDVIIEDGDLTINSDDHGMDVGGNAIIHGGNVEVTGDDDGLNVEGDIVILNGNVNVEARDYGLDSDEGSVTIAGGCVTIYTHDWSGISADKNVDIRGGELYITAYDAGIEADHVTLSGGYMEIAGDWCDVYAEEITLHVELPEDAYLEDTGYEMIIWSDEGLVIDASAQEDELAPVVFCYNGKILLENIPEGMMVMVAGYTDAQMTQLQMVADVTGDVVIREDILACEEVKAFFLDGGLAPVHISLPVM